MNCVFTGETIGNDEVPKTFHVGGYQIEGFERAKGLVCVSKKGMDLHLPRTFQYANGEEFLDFVAAAHYFKVKIGTLLTKAIKDYYSIRIAIAKKYFAERIVEFVIPDKVNSSGMKSKQYELFAKYRDYKIDLMIFKAGSYIKTVKKEDVKTFCDLSGEEISLCESINLMSEGLGYEKQYVSKLNFNQIPTLFKTSKENWELFWSYCNRIGKMFAMNNVRHNICLIVPNNVGEEMGNKHGCYPTVDKAIAACKTLPQEFPEVSNLVGYVFDKGELVFSLKREQIFIDTLVDHREKEELE